jgi:hypothetical protein
MGPQLDRSRGDKRARSSSATVFAPSHQRHASTKQVHPVSFSALDKDKDQVPSNRNYCKIQTASSRVGRPRPLDPAAQPAQPPRPLIRSRALIKPLVSITKPDPMLIQRRSNLCPRAKNAANSATSAQAVEVRNTSCSASK